MWELTDLPNYPWYVLYSWEDTRRIRIHMYTLNNGEQHWQIDVVVEAHVATIDSETGEISL